MFLAFGSLAGGLVLLPCRGSQQSYVQRSEIYVTTSQIFDHKSSAILYVLLLEILKLPELIFTDYIANLVTTDTKSKEKGHQNHQNSHQNHRQKLSKILKTAKTYHPELILTAVFNLLFSLFIVIFACKNYKFLGLVVVLLYLIEIVRFYERKLDVDWRELQGKGLGKQAKQEKQANHNYRHSTARSSKGQNNYQKFNFGNLNINSDEVISDSDRESIYCCEHY